MRPHLAPSIAMFLVLSLTAGAQDESSLRAEDRRAFAWFDTLGFPDVAGKPLVLVTTGVSWEIENGKTHRETALGFLLAESDSRLTILTPELLERSFPKVVPPEDDAREPASFVILDLETNLEELLAARRAPPDHPMGALGQRMIDRFGARIAERAEMLAWARHAEAHGLSALARELLSEARGTPNLRDGEVDERPIEEVVSDGFAESLLWRAVMDFGDVSVSRPRLLAQFRRIARCFPGCKHAPRVRETIEILERMIAEDEAHAKAATPLAQMTEEERIAELIWRLRDQPGGQMMQPGSPCVYSRQEETAAHGLVQIGWNAVPQLIEALTDRRFTRAVGFWRNFMFSHYVMRVGDAAGQVLSEITGRGFWSGNYTAASMAKDKEELETQRRARKWWKSYQEKGRRQSLIDDVLQEGRTSALRKILEEFPEDAVDVFLEAMAGTLEGRDRFWLMQTIVKAEDESLAPVLLEEMRQGKTLECRVLAAGWLHRHGRAEAMEVLIREWKARCHEDPDSVHDHGFDLLVTNLLWRGTPESARMVANDLPECPVGVRYQVVRDFRYRLPSSGVLPKWTESSLREVIEDLLAACLDDDEYTGVSTSTGDRSWNVTVSGIAAEGLARLYGRPDAFDPAADEEDRRLAIALLRNLYREKRGLPPLPSPSLPSPLPEGSHPLTVRSSDVPDVFSPLIGKPLTVEGLRPVLESLIAAIPPDSHGFRLRGRQIRHGGVVLELRTLLRREGANGEPLTWSLRTEVSVGADSMDGSWGHWLPEGKRVGAEDIQPFLDRLRRAIARADEGPIRFEIAVTGQVD